MRREGFKLEEIEIEHFLHLMNIYLSEWDHRATVLWSQVFKYFYATLVVIFLPNLAGFLEINLPEKFPTVLYPFAALPLSVVFLCVSLGCAKRAKDIGNTYKNLVKLLPEELRRVSLSVRDTNQNPIKQKPKGLRRLFVFVLNTKLGEKGKNVYHNLSYVICVLMFLVLVSLSIAMIIFCSSV